MSPSDHPLFSSLTFIGESSGPVKKLPGWRKHHRLPDEANPTTNEFIRKIGDPLVQEAGEELFQTLRRAFGYKRRDQEFAADTGTCEITTPDFTTHFQIELDPEATTRWSLKHTLGELQSEAVLDTEIFATVFDNRFRRVLCETGERTIEIEDVIDRIEDLPEESSPLRVDYPPNADRCQITIEGFTPILLVQPHAVTVECSGPSTIHQLVTAAKRLPELLGVPPETPLLLCDGAPHVQVVAPTEEEVRGNKDEGAS